MVLFWRLLLAHVIADFPLQTDAVFAIKKEKRWGVLLHGTIFGLVAILLAQPFLKSGTAWAGLIILWLLHIAIDKTKLIFVGGRRADHLAYFLLDQALHIGTISLVSLYLNRVLPVTTTVADSTADLYLIKLGIAYIVSVWASPLICYYVQAALSPRKIEFNAWQPVLWRMLGYVERGMLTAIMILGGKLFFLTPVAFLPRISLSVFANEKPFSLWELVLGSAIAISAGAWARSLG